MRRILAGVGVLLLGLAAAGSARADHPLSFSHHNQDDCKPRHSLLKLWPFNGHKDECSPKHGLLKLWPFGGHKLLGQHGQAHCGGCGYYPWFNTFKPCPPPDCAFPVHPFARSPRDFFMYEW